ncbi:hypothetical protein [Amycolatopsis anabasis]|uniref:hypothetical protein n=1 Tax=Amycolatopsis anabasis TaxID=1840409 RepID=UPI00131D4F34|nr:hypothetical protein [Amycolatopsis anabasis]
MKPSSPSEVGRPAPSSAEVSYVSALHQAVAELSPDRRLWQIVRKLPDTPHTTIVTAWDPGSRVLKPWAIYREILHVCGASPEEERVLIKLYQRALRQLLNDNPSPELATEHNLTVLQLLLVERERTRTTSTPVPEPPAPEPATSPLLDFAERMGGPNARKAVEAVISERPDEVALPPELAAITTEEEFVAHLSRLRKRRSHSLRGLEDAMKKIDLPSAISKSTLGDYEKKGRMPRDEVQMTTLLLALLGEPANSPTVRAYLQVWKKIRDLGPPPSPENPTPPATPSGPVSDQEPSTITIPQDPQPDRDPVPTEEHHTPATADAAARRCPLLGTIRSPRLCWFLFLTGVTALVIMAMIAGVWLNRAGVF